MEPEKKSTTRTKTIVIVVVLGVFTVFQLVTLKNNLTRKESKDPLIASLQRFHSFRPANNAFAIQVPADYETVQFMMSDDLPFAGVSKTPKDDDKPVLMVQRIPYDTALSALENWKKFQEGAGSALPQSQFYIPAEETKAGQDKPVFEIKSKDDSWKGIVRLARKGDFLYIVKGVSRAKHWDTYKTDLSYSVSMFLFL
ncbi:hypothetical protein SAMN04488109_6842 [Chryseolinea serpens]|uniref:Uncharacterized protein n=1 Tax=Chryseolinea serpens TaxID=947013 RepID=A0A1M5XT48_9BACT|nr:hypothetical protein [Chryseolinea serpens]SHI02929.1 hypothetical protein SAMN04488109_6842 [Chryseolinea serpens]